MPNGSRALGALQRLVRRDAMASTASDPVTAPPALPKSAPLTVPVAENDDGDPLYSAIEEALRAKGYLP